MESELVIWKGRPIKKIVLSNKNSDTWKQNLYLTLATFGC